MLADLLKVSVATIRRWHRRGLIVPVREVHRLPYFDFQEVATARRLAELVAGGASPAAIEKQLAELSRFVPEVERPLAQLSVIVEGQQLLLRQGEGLIEPGGQMRIDFESLEKTSAADDPSKEDDQQHATVPLAASHNLGGAHADLADTPADMLQQASHWEDVGRLDLAIELYRAALAAGGPKPEVCFQLAELLYRVGDVTAARERYYMAIEMDEDYVEARANLGCILAETGQTDLAVAAFLGALRFHPDYPDVHYHLARALDELGRTEEATEYWRTFLELAPGSPWADEAHDRLGIDV
jgi:tetratricopeptide (TPR) repeat protein